MVSFSVYVALMCLAFAAVLPLTLTYLKQHLHFGDNVVQMVSTGGIAGNVVGFFLYGFLQKHWGIRNLQLFTHGLYIAVPLFLALCPSTVMYYIYIVGGMTFLGSFAFACFLCMVSQETLALSPPGNVAMATAFNQTYYMLGTACGRAGSAALLGSGALAMTWKHWSWTFCEYQTIFLVCAVISIFALVLIPSLPSVVPNREDWYKPKG